MHRSLWSIGIAPFNANAQRIFMTLMLTTTTTTTIRIYLQYWLLLLAAYSAVVPLASSFSIRQLMTEKNPSSSSRQPPSRLSSANKANRIDLYTSSWRGGEGACPILVPSTCTVWAAHDCNIQLYISNYWTKRDGRKRIEQSRERTLGLLAFFLLCPLVTSINIETNDLLLLLLYEYKKRREQGQTSYQPSIHVHENGLYSINNIDFSYSERYMLIYSAAAAH